MAPRGLLRFAAFAFVLFFAVMVLTVLALVQVSPSELLRLEHPIVQSFKTSPFRHLLFSGVMVLRAVGIFLTNLRFLAIALVGAGLFRVQNPFARLLAWVGLVYYGFGFLANAVFGGIVVVTTAHTKHVAWPLVWLLGILPHGLFEIAAYCLGLAALVAAMRPSGIQERRLLWILLPVALLLFAALVESGVTPHLIALLG